MKNVGGQNGIPLPTGSILGMADGSENTLLGGHPPQPRDYPSRLNFLKTQNQQRSATKSDTQGNPSH